MTEHPEGAPTLPASEAVAPAGTWVRDARERVSGIQRRVGVVAVIVLFAGGLFTLRGFLPALLWAAIFAIALSPLFERLARRWPRHRRLALPLGMVVAILLVFIVPVTMITVSIVAESHAAAQWIAEVRQNGVAPPALLDSLPFGPRLTSLWRDEIGQPGELGAMLGHAMQGSLLTTGRAIGAQALHRLVLLGFMLLALFFLLRDLDGVAAQLRLGCRRLFGAPGEIVGRQIVMSVHGTVNGLVLVGLGEGVILGVVYVATGCPHPVLFGLVTALLAIVPFGAPVAFGLAALVVLAGGNPVGAIVIVAAGLVVTFVADHFIRPVLIGGATQLPFVWVLLGILGGVEAWGLVGLFVGPAIMAALILLWREWVGSQRGPLNPLAADLAAAETRLLSDSS